MLKYLPALGLAFAVAACATSTEETATAPAATPVPMASATPTPTPQPSPAATPMTVAGDVESGTELFASHCRGCHTTSIAPTLRGVVGRQIAGVATYSGYSAGLKAKSGETWNAANLDAFLASPSTFAPGSIMAASLSEAKQRADVIAYMATLPPPRQ